MDILLHAFPVLFDGIAQLPQNFHHDHAANVRVAVIRLDSNAQPLVLDADNLIAICARLAKQIALEVIHQHRIEPPRT